jgi:predicted metal-dependent peptidase
VSGPFDPDLAFASGGFEGWPVRVLAAARQVERNGGKLPGGAALLIDRLTRPVLNWRDLLARFVARSRRAERRWDRPDRRFIARGLYMPGRIASSHRLVVAIDVSGSTLSCLPRFLGELSGVLASGSVETVRVLTFDAALQLDRVLSSRDIGGVAGLRLQGGGGTDFQPMFARLQDTDDAADGIIILTDGFGRVPRSPPPCPVLWVLTADGRQPADWGERVRLPRDAQDQANRW